jgi:hypothetical protein
MSRQLHSAVRFLCATTLLLALIPRAFPGETGGNITLFQTTTAAQKQTIEGDAFEIDDTPGQASWIGVGGGPQRHTHHDLDDEDWAKFFATTNQIITIFTENLDSGADTYLELFSESDTVNPIGSDDNSGLEGNGSSALNFFIPPADGFYLLRVTHATNGFGADTGYDLKVIEEIGGDLPGTLLGVVAVAGTDLAQLIPDAIVTLTDFGNITAQIDPATDAYLFPAIPHGTYTVMASADGYESQTRSGIFVESEMITELNFELTALASDPEDINGDGTVDAVDVQLVINAVLGIDIAPNNGDADNSGEVDAVDIQLVINQVLGV